MNENTVTQETPIRTRNTRPREEEDRIETTVRKRIVFSDSESDTETEVFFDCQAHKKRRTMANDEMKIWIEKQFATNLSKVATKEQVDGLSLIHI